MDLNAFNNPNFDAKAWINASLKSKPPEDDDQSEVTNVMGKLQLYYQQVNSEFEETSQGVMKNLPRVLHDIENISKEAETLKHKMSLVKQEIANVEKNTGKSIAALERIDKIKSKYLIQKFIK